MAEMNEARRDNIRARARATTYAMGRGIMPAWVANKPWCRWAWENLPTWRAIIESRALDGQTRARMNRHARVCFAAAMAWQGEGAGQGE